MRTRLTILMAAGALLGSLALGDDPVDPPGRAARLSYLNGTVSFQPGGVEDWVAAELNRPLTAGDRIWTEDGARAEMMIGSAAFRLNSHTNFSFLNLDDKTAQIQISIGTLSVRVRHLDDDETFEIDTPQAAFSLLRPGDYRVDVNEAGDATLVTVRGGEVEATASGQAFPIHTREQVRITSPANDGDEPGFDRRSIPPADPYDNWCMDRDRREDMSQSAKYVSRDMPGYSDLDAAGTWSQDAEYGAVWMPTTVAVGWAPYRSGHWVWIAPWGWTWIDEATWGYAPFHYGRWAFVGGGWGWIPGPMAVRPVYAPAMVAWVGGGGFGAALSIGGGGAAVGWFPLGPREVFVPSYGVSERYMTRVNVSNTVVSEVNVRNVYVNRTSINNATYVNQRINGAVTAVPHSAMVSGRPVSAAVVRVPPGAVARGEVMHGAPVAPDRSAVLGGRAPVNNHMPPPELMNRRVVAKAAPPPAPVSFSRQQEALRANPGKPVDGGTIRNLQGSQPEARPNIRSATPASRGVNNNTGGNNERRVSPNNAPANNNPVDRTPVTIPENRPTRVAPAPSTPARTDSVAPANRTPPPQRNEQRPHQPQREEKKPDKRTEKKS